MKRKLDGTEEEDVGEAFSHIQKFMFMLKV